MKSILEQLKQNPLALLILFIATLFWFFSGGEKTIPIPKAKVRVEKPKVEPITDYVYQTGNTRAFQSVELVARVKGYLKEITFEDGSLVKKGDNLFVIEPQPYLEQLNEEKASLQSAEASLLYSKAEYKRQQKMYSQQATSQNSVEVWRSRLDQSKADVKKAKANVVNAEINYSYTHVKSPFDGRIGRHLIDVGNLVGESGSTQLAQIEQMMPLYVYFNLNELDFMRLYKAARAQGVNQKSLAKIPVYIGTQDENGFPHTGQLDFVNTRLNASTGTMELRAILKNQDKQLVPGLFVRVRIPISKAKDSLTVPNTAVMYDQIGPYLLVANDKNIVLQKHVTVGTTENKRTVIKENLSASDRVIVEGMQYATPGKEVEILNPPTPTNASPTKENHSKEGKKQ